MKKTCLECGELKEHHAKGMCKSCYKKKYSLENSEKIKKWKLENPEKINAISRKYYQKNSGKLKEAGKKYRLKNKGKISAYNRKYRLENLEKLKAHAKKWYFENSERVKAKNRLKNPEKVKAYNKKWHLKNQKKVKARNRKWYLENSKKQKITHRKWKLENPGKVREAWLRRRSHGIVKKGVIDRVITENIFKYGIVTCEHCKKQCPNLPDYHIDHIIPVSKGGSNDYNNLQILCQYCNLNKNVEIADYRQISKNNQKFLTISGGEN